MAPKFIVIDFDEIDFLKTLIFSWEANFKMLVLSFPIFSFLLPLMLFYPFLKFELLTLSVDVINFLEWKAYQ